VWSLGTGESHRWHLGRDHYLRTDESWEQAGKPEALVELGLDDTYLNILVETNTGEIVAPLQGQDNLLDNERSDVNADGVQLYFGPDATRPFARGWLIVPASPVRVTPLTTGVEPVRDISWSTTPSGWSMRIRVPREILPVQNGQLVFDLIVNERPAYRDRRRDRHDSASAVALRLT
jgi:hypothetical protein